MKFLLKAILVLLMTLTLGAPVYAATTLDLGAMTQSQFDSLIREAGTLITYRAMAPADPGGLAGFDISLAASAVKIDSALWDAVLPTENVSSDYIYLPSIRARKGLPFGIEVGASYSATPGNDIQVFGGEVQWAMMDGSAATPAVALRGHYSKLLNVNDLSLTSYGVDAVISKGFTIFTPYAGIGAVYMDGDYTGSLPANLTLNKYSNTTARYFGGLLMTITLFQVTADIEYIEQPVYSLKVGIGW